MTEHIHFIGIKGVGMSALAIVAKGLGYTVTGSDVAERFRTDDSLRDTGITPTVFDATNITDSIDRIVIGAAYGDDNPELKEAKRQNIPILTYSQFLNELSKQKKTLVITGTHGKTTTTSLTTYLLRQAGKDPSWIVGTTEISGLPSHGGAGQGDYFVVEGDEYKRAANDLTPKFLDLTPHAVIINNIEHDHPDVYPTFDNFIDAFRRLIQHVPDNHTVICNGDDATIQDLMREIPGKAYCTYGYKTTNNYHIQPLASHTSQHQQFQLQHGDDILGPFALQLQGQHNVYNATAAIVMNLTIGVGEDDIIHALPNFQTVERRFQTIGQYGGVTIIDDFAHHPTAVRMTLETAKKIYPHRPLWCLFQAHTYSRTKALLPEFSQAFSAADTVVITDIFASAREKEVSITAQELSQAIQQHHTSTHYVPVPELIDYLKASIPHNAVLITMGASDIYKVGKSLIDLNAEKTTESPSSKEN